MANNYLDFITDEDLFSCIRELHSGYKRALESKGLNDFLKNRIDPIKFIFDSRVLDMTIEEYLQREIVRQSDKTISNYIGDFHENLLGKVFGYQKLAVGNLIDIVSDDGKLVAEIKNKHNTVKGEDKIGIFNKLERILNDPEKNVESAFYVRIIDTRSQKKNWKFSKNKETYENENIFIISGDKFYELITGNENAFADLCSVLPRAFDDFLSSLSEEEKIKPETSTVIEELKSTDINMGNKELLEKLFKENFSTYNGFTNFTIKD